MLAADHHVVAVDLPGHGFTRLGSRGRSGLPAMAADLAALCRQQGWRPQAIVGHSAGGAVALQMVLDDPGMAQCVIGLNAALGHFEGLAGWLFPVLAKALALNPLTATFVAATSSERTVTRLLDSTGSATDPQMRHCYGLLLRKRAHIDGALLMMASWSLDGLLSRLDRIATPVLLLTGGADKAVAPAVSREAAKTLPNAQVTDLPGLGHLMHEEAPDRICALIRTQLAQIAPRERA
jgi:magnesium chelatase accessory protein